MALTNTGNPVSILNDYSQKLSLKLIYEDLGFEGPDNNRQFSMRVVLDGKPYPKGVGKKKKDAKLAAAENALKLLRENQPPDTTENSANATPLVSQTINYIGWLNEYGQKNRMHIRPVETIRPGPQNAIHYCKFIVGDTEYPDVCGKTKRKAKEKAAKVAYERINADQSRQVGDSSGQQRDFTDSSPQNMQTSSSDSIIFCDYSNPAESQKMFRKSGSGRIGSSANMQEPPKVSQNEALDPSDHSAEHNDVENRITANASTPPVESRVTSDFETPTFLGKGGYGSVFKAKEKLVDRHYAVKVVSYSEKAFREVKALSDLHHENIVRYFHCWIEDSKKLPEIIQRKLKDITCEKYLFIKMEFCNSTLKQWIKEMNEKEVQHSQRGAESLPIAKQIVTGVKYIHDNNLIHRDLKPENIMFGKDGKVKIGDFGLVTVDKSEDVMERTQGRGTKSYMAPEQKSKSYDHKVDIFALGLIFFELLWKFSTFHEKMTIWDDVRDNKLSTEFSQAFPLECIVIKSLLSNNPKDRPEASELQKELERLNKQHMHLENQTV
ncbi:interferon-induced, double-stranded RNA-activated protein kinase-like [Cyprinodon tularosa]|uniref:interferon-induced, double-stranded RNA-activated protein kinase-like n=1 Tax=Cyprinodon tularosa TaxID=77115 RepID=UPI0018E1E110|nr:interferon-induced, double-stranded RNA-activated protein kinase-like [Cyprinodon tularosa]